jgi:small subunit ribosomal protein S20
MPNIKSAKKRLRQDIVRHEKNRSTKRALRTQCKKVLEAVEARDADKAQAELQIAAKKLDTAASKNTIHRNAAARLKSRLSAKVKSVKQAAK